MKKLLLTSIILLCIVTLGIFPTDMFLFTVPEWVIYTLLGVIAALVVLLFIKQKKKAPRITAVILTVITAVTSVVTIRIDPYFNGISFHRSAEPTLPYDTLLSADKAIADLDYAMYYLRKLHPKYYNGYIAPPEKMADWMESEIEKAGSVTVNELTAYISRVFSVLGDAHTSASFRYADMLYLKHYYRRQSGGWKIKAINDTTIKELLTEKAGLFSFEAESWELETMKQYLISVQGLDYLGFDVSGGITYTYENDDGEVQSETYFPEDFVTYDEYITYNGEGSTKDSRNEAFVRFTIDDEKSLAILTLDECNFNDEYINCLRDMFTHVKQKGIRNVAVDLRENGGGNDQVAVEFIRYLDTDEYDYASETMRLGFFMTALSEDHKINARYNDLTFTGNVYILTSSASFSSAMLFAQYIKDNRLGTLIGEPPGNDPNGYGDISTFCTPNAGIRFSISTKHFFRADKNCADKYVMPDVECDADNAVDMLYNMI
ncbi:MAG: hypothetical protein IJU82_08885 [Ruminiclostridium sp.]|nr:hypothetical protein [Ruminiclostridium sp.]